MAMTFTHSLDPAQGRLIFGDPTRLGAYKGGIMQGLPGSDLNLAAAYTGLTAVIGVIVVPDNS